MQILFLGTGGAFDPEYGNSAAMVICNGKTYLIDCGFTVYGTLKKFDLFNRIDYVLLTHLHNDHTGSLVNATLHYNLISNGGNKKIRIASPSKKFRKQVKRMMDVALQESDDFVEWIALKDLPDITVIDTHSRHVNQYQTWGYIFREGDEVMVYSGDIGDGDYVFSKLKKKKIKQATVFHELSLKEVPGHTIYTQLIPHLKEYRIYGYHCDPRNNKPDNPIPLVADHPEFLMEGK